jgi:hypothetical protein
VTQAAIALNMNTLDFIMEYKAQTNHVFPLTETVAVARLLVQGSSKADIRRQVLEEDLFELRSRSSREGALQAVLRRLDQLPYEYLELLAQGNSDTKRLTLLFLVLREHRLLRELIAEVLVEKLKGLDPTLTATDLKAFFDTKREQEAILAQWSDSTFQKATSNTVLVLVRSGLLQPLQAEDTKGSYEIRAVPSPAALRQQLISDGYGKYLTLMLN